jgi:hypothetical protein
MGQSTEIKSVDQLKRNVLSIEDFFVIVFHPKFILTRLGGHGEGQVDPCYVGEKGKL